MAAAFCKHAGLKADFGEAISYHMTNVISSFIPARRLLDHHERFVEHFKASDQAMRILRPDLFSKLPSGTLSFGMKWEMSLFAVPHSGVTILNIWDQIFGRVERLPEFVQALTIAHVIQLQIEVVDDHVDAKEGQKWDALNIVEDATRILTHERSCREAFCVFACPF
jgi:hypothetical protein